MEFFTLGALSLCIRTGCNIVYVSAITYIIHNTYIIHTYLQTYIHTHIHTYIHTCITRCSPKGFSATCSQHLYSSVELSAINAMIVAGSCDFVKNHTFLFPKFQLCFDGYSDKCKWVIFNTKQHPVGGKECDSSGYE